MAKENSAALLLAFLAICVHGDEDPQQKSAGFKKVSIEKREEFPDVEEFFMKFVVPSVPVVFRDETFVLVPDFEENDLATAPLSFTTYVTARKRGDKSARYHMSVRQFLKRYRKEDLYLDDAIPTNIKPYVPLPRCLMCETVFNELLSTRLLFHHGKQEGDLLATERNFLGCQISGTSKIYFYSPVTLPHHEVQGEEENTAEMRKTGTGDKIYLNVDKVNQTKFANLKAGDCAYIPSLWLHQWTTRGNSVNVGLYWSNRKIIPTSKFCANQSEQNFMVLNFKDDPKPDLESLFMFDDLLHFIKNYFLKNEEESMTFKTFEKDLQEDQKYMESLVEWNSECSTIAKEMFQQMDTNDDGFLSLTDFDKLSYKDLQDIAGKIDDRLADFEDIFEDQKAEQKGSLFDVVKNSASNYENDFRKMIDEEFDEIFREMEASGKDQKDKEEKLALKDSKTIKETDAESKEFENVKSAESEIKESSRKPSDNGATAAKENSEIKRNTELKDEL